MKHFVKEIPQVDLNSFIWWKQEVTFKQEKYTGVGTNKDNPT